MAEQRIFTARDDRFHFDELAGDWWSTETAWFSFSRPERRLGGWLYTLARPTIGTVAGGAWIWDDSAHLPWEVLYSANYTALELPRDQDLDDVTLPTGVSIRVIEPCMSYALGYNDEPRLRATQRVKIVLLGNPVATTANPLRLSEELAMIDLISGGRLVPGWVRGAGSEQLSNNTNPALNRELFEEGIDVVIQAWTKPGPFRYEGKHFHYRHVNPWVLPLQEPHPPFWIPGLNQPGYCTLARKAAVSVH